MLVHVRTTIRLPDELYTEVRVQAATQGATVTSFIEEALRAALRRHLDRATTPAYVVEPYGSGGVLPGVDLDDNAALAELMDADDRA